MASRRTRLAQRRKATGYSQERLAELLGVDRSTIVRWEAADSEPQPWLRPKLAAALDVSVEGLRELLDDVGDASGTTDPPSHVSVEQRSMGHYALAVMGEEDDMERRRLLASLAVLGVSGAVSPANRALEAIRASVGDAFMAADRDVQHWEERVVEYGYTYLTAPPQEFMAELAADLVNLRLIVGDMRTDTLTYRDWCRVAGALSGLMAKTLSNLGQTSEARQWWQTAQAVSDTSGDLEARLWVRGERITHGLYEQRPPRLLLRQAAEAMELARGHPCHGLAHASTGRAQALGLAGDFGGSQAELSRSEQILSRLPAHISTDQHSVHGWGEDRLRYTETWVHAYSGDAAKTDAAAEQAKPLYQAGNCRSPAQIDLLQAFVRTQSGDVTEGIRHAHATYELLPPEHRTTMIVELAQQVLRPVSGETRKRADVTAYRALVASAAT